MPVRSVMPFLPSFRPKASFPENFSTLLGIRAPPEANQFANSCARMGYFGLSFSQDHVPWKLFMSIPDRMNDAVRLMAHWFS
jgi:hypothetical protein